MCTRPQVKDADEDVAPSVRAFLKAPPPEPSADTPKQVLLARDPKAMHRTSGVTCFCPSDSEASVH